MKRGIDWHMQCANNFYKSIEYKIKERDSLNESILRMSKEYVGRLEQIVEAEKRGLSEFDSDKLLVKKKVKASK